jgi:hypothetical protein
VSPAGIKHVAERVAELRERSNKGLAWRGDPLDEDDIDLLVDLAEEALRLRKHIEYIAAHAGTPKLFAADVKQFAQHVIDDAPEGT